MIQELHAGDRQIPASSWNEMRAAVQGITPGQQQYQSGKLNPVYITVKNVTGSDLPAFSVVKLSGATYSRTGDTFINQAISNGIELDGDTPASATDTIAITQAACAAGGFVKAIADGCTPAFVYKDSNKDYAYAKPVSGQTGYLKGTDDATSIRILWIASGTGKKEAYVCIDASGKPTPEYFVINYKNSGANDPDVYTKGSLHYVYYNAQHGCWLPISANEATPATAPTARQPGTKLVICQEDAPNSTTEYHMPYFTPESNMGVPAKITTYNTGTFGKRCGVLLGEHEFTNKAFDYLITGVDGSGGTVTANTGLTFCYTPVFIEDLTVNGTTGGGHTVYADVFGQEWVVGFPASPAGLSQMSYPDIYPGDSILALVDTEKQICSAMDYSKDYPEGKIMAYYYAIPGRGWDYYTTPQALSDIGFDLYIKVKTSAIL